MPLQRQYNKHYLRDTKVKQTHSENIHHHPPHPNSQRNEDIDVIGNISDFGTLNVCLKSHN